ncbi:MAG: zinc ABC transporter substrate-binding protein [Chloroflexi bacterium]|nr:zinc ABC transporter substrate-binding protein [Chloroflexota bacterium]
MIRKLGLMLFLAIVMAACQSAPAPARATVPALNVVAAETFLADIAQNVAGERATVKSLMPIGVDPHSFEPTPQDVATVADSTVLIINGSGFEGFLDELLENAGGERIMIEASAGLVGRTAREGEEAVMSDDDLADAMCAAVDEATAQDAVSGITAQSPVDLPAESGLFNVVLGKQADGTYAGYLKYATDVSDDFQIVTGVGQVSVNTAADGTPIDIETTLSVSCANLTQGYILELEKDGQYVIALTGFTTDRATLLIGPSGGHHHDEGDPHFWLDPNNAVKYVENVRDALRKIDPATAVYYGANADKYIQQLKALDQTIRDQVATIPESRRLIVTNHESFGYFADRYGFKVIGTIIPSVSTGSAPSAQQLARLIDQIKATGASAIFLETGTNPQLAQQIASETGIKVVTELYSHSLSDARGPAPTYIDMIQSNVAAIVKALK